MIETTTWKHPCLTDNLAEEDADISTDTMVQYHDNDDNITECTETNQNIQNELKAQQTEKAKNGPPTTAISTGVGSSGAVVRKLKSRSRHNYRADPAPFQEFKFTKAVRVEPGNRSIEVSYLLLLIVNL